jgi:crotonobetainyl-CoA:carnitine CoA-transferase CaiB-like acyl-CoA transferase
MTEPTGPLRGIKVFDLTRVLAGPTCVQMLADLGADVIKIEKPGSGDDTRGFAPPFMPGTKESAYFVGVNRNKRSVTLDIAKPKGQQIALDLIAQSDILVENFKVGALAKYGLGYQQLHERFPGLIYCSITGFGQTGPYAPRPGYDSLVQAMGGVMSLTGEPEGTESKARYRHADPGDEDEDHGGVGRQAGSLEDRLRADQYAAGGVRRPSGASARRRGADAARRFRTGRAGDRQSRTAF